MAVGAKRSINRSPSEFVKYTLILALAKYFHSINNDNSFIKTLIIPLIITTIPVLLVITQPDLGTALIILLGGVSLFWISGLNYKYFIVGIFSIICSLPFLWQYLKEYQKERLMGLKTDEKTRLELPINKEGDRANYELIVNNVEREILPNLDDDFIKLVNPELSSLNDLRSDVEKKIQAN